MSILRAREAFAFTDSQGVPRVVRPGDLFDDRDPSVVGRENLFEPVETAAYRTEAAVTGASGDPALKPGGVEAATAAPGEKRSVSTSHGGRGGRSAAKVAADKTEAEKAAEKKAAADKAAAGSGQSNGGVTPAP